MYPHEFIAELVRAYGGSASVCLPPSRGVRARIERRRFAVNLWPQETLETAQRRLTLAIATAFRNERPQPERKPNA